MKDLSLVSGWKSYYRTVESKPPSFLARMALQHVPFKGAYLDVGAGTMNDSRLALEEGFHRVEALDNSLESGDYARNLQDHFGRRFQFTQSAFSEFDFGADRYDWIHSNFALPYFGQDQFLEFLERVKAGVKSAGILSATFFGHNDEWYAMHRDYALVSEADLRKVFSGEFSLVFFKEKEAPGLNYDRSTKHWHFYQVIAKRSSAALDASL